MMVSLFLTQRRFIEALKELRLGRCSQQSARFINTLRRDLEGHTNCTHIFFLKLSSRMHNLNVLRYMPGDMVEIHADVQDNGKIKACPAERVLRLKANCKVMLLWNKSDSLRNGTIGTFEKIEEQCAIVNFPGVGSIRVGKETWLTRDKLGKVIGSVNHIPLENLQVINFRPKFFLNVPREVFDHQLVQRNDLPRDDLSCCVKQAIADPAFFTVTDKRCASDSILVRMRMMMKIMTVMTTTTVGMLTHR